MYGRLLDAEAYWEKHAPFNGIPFRADLEAGEIKRILDIFSLKGMNCKSAVSV